MELQQRINAFATLGNLLAKASEMDLKNDQQKQIPEEYRDDVFFHGLLEEMRRASAENGWFTSDNIGYAFKSWSELLTSENLSQWLESYEWTEKDPKTVAIVMAGNLPLVGFHDFLSVLICGHKAQIKLSSSDSRLLPYLILYLKSVEPGFEDYITITEDRLSGFDAVIATGSNNTARYFEYYFKSYPHIIRKNRSGVAVLDGKESPEQLVLLADDVFRYFGLGCRSISKIFVPTGYDFDAFFQGMFNWKELVQHSKYMNNYDYNKAVYLMSNVPLLDNEFMLLKEDSEFSSPISVVFYEYYDSEVALSKKLAESNGQIQCVISDSGIENALPFGSSQQPGLQDYADGIDTVDFLLKL